MPKPVVQKKPLKKTSRNPPSTKKSAGEEGLKQVLANALNGTDEIEISPETKTREIKKLSMADVAKVIDGIKFLVKGWVPYGMVTLVIAAPGVGKSYFVLWSLVRPIVTGGLRWFTGLSGPKEPGYVMWCDTEGSNAINVDRIKKCGIPLDKILLPFPDDPLRQVDLSDPTHLKSMERRIANYKIKLVVVDSLRGAHSGDENSSRMDQVLKQLVGLAERTQAAVVVIHHLNKTPDDIEPNINNSRGSNAIAANVRSALLMYKPNPKEDTVRVWVAKENLGIKPKPIGFKITSNGLTFCDAPEKERKEATTYAEQLLLTQELMDGEWKRAKPIQEEASSRGISNNKLQRAREELGITKENDCVKKEDGIWWWRLPKKLDVPKG